ncbi:putative pheophorbide a oxygenase [Helianthus debilis subsp. tardiflorus]
MAHLFASIQPTNHTITHLRPSSSPPPTLSFRRMFSIRVACVTNAEESVPSDRWLAVSRIEKLHKNHPNLVVLRKRGIVVRVEYVNNRWVGWLHKGKNYGNLQFDGCGSCAQRQIPLGGARFPVKVSNGVLFLWPDEDGWKEARGTEPPSINPADTMPPISGCCCCCCVVISEESATDYRGTSADEKLSSDAKSVKADSLNEKLTDVGNRPNINFFVNFVLQFAFVLQFLFQNKEINDLFTDFLKPHLINTLNSWSQECISMFIRKYPQNPNLVAFITFAGMLTMLVAAKKILEKKADETTIK